MGAEAEDEDVELLRQAQEWHETLATGDPQAGKAFGEWLLTSPRHIAAYLKVGAISLELTGLDRRRKFDLEQLRSQGEAQK
jgi:ferric-dicitrate binding protein FerR (iron transport regulator)